MSPVRIIYLVEGFAKIVQIYTKKGVSILLQASIISLSVNISASAQSSLHFMRAYI